jgi:hypothetical protein
MKHATFKRSLTMVLAILALSPTGVLGQGRGYEEQNRDQHEAVETTPQQARLETAEALDDPEDGRAAAEESPEQSEEGPRVISGMSILGNQEAPTSLVIVPWKSSEIGNSIDISTLLDDSRQPVDKEVFMRALRYYEIRSETAP